MSSLLCRKNTKTYGKTNTFGGICYARQIFLVIIIFLKSLFFGKTEDATIFQNIPKYSNQRRRFALKLSIWKTKTKNLPDLIPLSQFFSNARIKLKIPEEGLSRFFNNLL